MTRPSRAQRPLAHPARWWEIWCLWDAADLISVHLTETDAQDAYEAHLLQLSDLAAEDQALHRAAVEVQALRVQR